MKNEFVRRYIYIIIALIFLVLAGINYFFLEKRSLEISDEHYTSALKKHLQKEIAKSKSELVEVGISYQKAQTNLFSTLIIPTKYPIYIFEDGKLIYWSSNNYVPDYQAISQLKNTDLLSTNNGKFIINRLQLIKQNKQIRIFSLINIYQKLRNENDYLTTGYNTDFFTTAPEGLEKSINSKEYQAIQVGDTNETLFYVSPPKLTITATIPANTLIFVVFFMLFLGLYTFALVKHFHKKKEFGNAFLVLSIYLLLVRLLMIYSDIPHVFIDWNLFNPTFFYANYLTPSLGDLFLNVLVGCFLLRYLSLHYYHFNLYFLIIKSSKNTKNYVSVLCVLISFFVTYLCYNSIVGMYQKSNYSLDFSLQLVVSSLKISSLLIYWLFFMLFFLTIHLASGMFLRLNKPSKNFIFRWAYGFILGTVLLIFVDTFRWIYPLTGIYFLLIYLAKYPRYLYRFRYRTALYFFFGAFVFAIIMIYIVHEQDQQRDLLSKEQFGVRYLSENDLVGEGLLAKATQTISEDTAIIDALTSTTLAREKIQQLVKSKHLDLYFDQYDTEVLAFDNTGNSFDTAEGTNNLNFYTSIYQIPAYKTANSAIFFVNQTGSRFIKQYLTFVPITQNGNFIGEIVLHLKLRTEFVESIHQELLMNKKSIQEPESRNYSYAIFNASNKLIYRSGNFNYEQNLINKTLITNDLYTKGVSSDDYHHLGIKGKNNRKIIVSSKNNSWQNLFSHFSFLFLLLLVAVVLMLTLYAIRYRIIGFNVNYSARIQIYLTTFFLLPSFVVVILTLSVIYTTFNTNQDKTYVDAAKNIASTFQIYVDNFQNNHISRPFLEQIINNLARDTKVDINFYDLAGKLNLTTRPLIFDYGLKASYINPEAYRRLIEQKETEVILPESVENLTYKATYVAIKDYNGRWLGVMEVPFFDAKLTLDRQIIEVIASILSTFVLIFLFLLIISYYASTLLTKPLRMIIQKLKRTRLDKPNEPLEWKSDDEIGLLVKEYNKLVGKLQESRMALSQSEKQSAWREMAKQVAHEIKNPLTPMKLSIQQLQRTLPADNPAARERIERTLNSLTEQIDNISNIANSFSEFAKMPVLTNEYFDIVPVLQKTVDLYNEQHNISLNLHLKEDANLVIGDRQFVSRVLTNLLLNGIQSVPVYRKPIIHVRVYRNTEENFMVIEIQDNGLGIPEDIREKVFSPNFSTKSGGSGLGLVMARRGIEQGGGNIWFETEEDAGTTFFVQLLLADKQ